GDHRGDVVGAALGGDLVGHDDVDAVRLTVRVGVHPGQHVVELVGVVVADAAGHAHAAGAGDGGGDGLGRGEGEDRVLDAELLGQRGADTHLRISLLASAGRDAAISAAQR